LLFGAKRVFMLGFDMKPSDGHGNWHRREQSSSTSIVLYAEFRRNFQYVVNDWHQKFSSHEIYNVTDDSALPSTWFPQIAVKDLWSML